MEISGERSEPEKKSGIFSIRKNSFYKYVVNDFCVSEITKNNGSMFRFCSPENILFFILLFYLMELSLNK